MAIGATGCHRSSKGETTEASPLEIGSRTGHDRSYSAQRVCADDHFTARNRRRRNPTGDRFALRRTCSQQRHCHDRCHDTTPSWTRVHTSPESELSDLSVVSLFTNRVTPSSRAEIARDLESSSTTWAGNCRDHSAGLWIFDAQCMVSCVESNHLVTHDCRERSRLEDMDSHRRLAAVQHFIRPFETAACNGECGDDQANQTHQRDTTLLTRLSSPKSGRP